MPGYAVSPDRTMLIYRDDKKTVVPMRDIDTFTYHNVLNHNQKMKYDNWATSLGNRVHESMVDHVDFRRKQSADVANQMPYKPVQEDATLNLKLSPETQYEIGLKYYNGEGVSQDFRKAAKCFRLAADQGFPAAQRNLGDMYANGRGIRQNYAEAVKWYRLAADQGNADAQRNLGVMYQYGRVRRNYAEAVKWYRLAADQGNADAQNNLGVMYSNGRVRRNYAEAVKWYRLAAEQGHICAQNNLGVMYSNGQGVRRNYAEAVEWYRMAADQGDTAAQNNLGVMYANGEIRRNYKRYRLAAVRGDSFAQKNPGYMYSNGEIPQNYKRHSLAAYHAATAAQNNLGVMYSNGQGVRQNYAEAVEWYRMAADQGDTAAQNNLGYMYANGLGVAQNYAEAVKWYRLAADQGDADAQNNLGYMYANGLGVAQNYAEAVKWYEWAAWQGFSLAQYNLGVMYETGKGVNKDYSEALKWYGLAANQGHGDAIKWLRWAANQGNSGAQYTIGAMYHNGKGVNKDYSEAAKWYRLAADQGDSDAQYNLGVWYHNGKGVNKDYSEAAKWYRLAADQGDSDAQYNLGYMYANGLGVAQNYTEAMKWYRMAADQGDSVAQYILGEKYEDGHGVTQDYSEAVKWYRLAADQGYTNAQNHLGNIYRKGLGVTQDYDEAAKWYHLAAEQGDEEAKGKLLELAAFRSQGVSPSDKLPPSPKPIHLDAKSSDTRLNEIVEKLNKLIGLERVKKEIYQIMQLVRIREMRKTKGLKIDRMSLHSVFLGSPGTGKTTVARIYGQILKALGLLSKGHLVETDRSGLVAGYVGQTEEKTDTKIQQALGGILFIDEAYSLSKSDDAGWDYGREAISILLKRMEDHRDDFVVIVAGYDNPMEKFLRSNEGLKSRFSRHIHFDDFSTDELVEIFQLICSEGGYEIGSAALELTRTLVSKAYSQRDESFGNARYVRNLFEDVVRNQNVRLAETAQEPSHKDLVTILPDDIPKGPQVCRESLDELLAQLNKLIGLDQVKSEIYQLTQFVRVQQMRRTQGLSDDPVSLHCVFFGNPGTGKTTVARIYGKLLNAMGLLSRGHVVETDRSGLVAGYVGQTEGKTDEKVRESLGGILFIDEAYSLSKGEDSQNDFANEAISILLKRMEDHRDDFVVIVAGYDKPMAELLESNEGLKSRFSTHIHFPDYSPKELLEIFKLFCKEKRYEIEGNALKLVQRILENEYQNRDETFGNGRLVRNLFESVKKNQAVRLAESPNKLSLSDLVTILPDDVRPLLNKKQEPVVARY